MQFEQIVIIPDRNQIDESVQLANAFGCGFEYQDFFAPRLLDNEALCEQLLEAYETMPNKPAVSTFHGVFLDITIFTQDQKIKAAVDERVEMSLQQASRLGAKGVVFHTNYVTNFRQKEYRDSWVNHNARYWREKLEKYPNLEIYIENMFDDSPELLARLGASMKNEERFGVCFDYAHAFVFGGNVPIEEWVRTLAPYTKHIHINDNNKKEDQHLALGDGKIDWKQFKKFYEQYFVDCSVLVEVSGLDQIRQSLEYLQNL